MVAYDDFTTAMASASSYFAADDYQNAWKYVQIARFALAQIPNSASDNTLANWRNDLETLSAAIKEASSIVAAPMVVNAAEMVSG
jgi:hypothetical protein